MAGYSGTPLPRKLGIAPEARFALVGAPDGIDDTLGELPEGVRVASPPSSTASSPTAGCGWRGRSAPPACPPT
jgi:hypothetical protein